MSLSKPISAVLLAYLDQLLTHPVRTKALTNSVLSVAAGNLAKYIHDHSLSSQRINLAYALYGLIFGGSVQHMVKRLLSKKLFAVKFGRLSRFLIDRFIQTPINLCLALYFLSRFELQSHRTAFNHLERLYWPLLKSNWQCLSLIIFLNMYYTPILLQPFTAGCIYYCWLIYIGYRRHKMHPDKRDEQKPNSDQLASS